MPLLGEIGECRSHLPFALVSLVQQHAIAQVDFLPFFQREALFGRRRRGVPFAFGKTRRTKRIGGKQAVRSHVPIGRIAKTAGMVENRNSLRLTFNRPVVIDPRGPFSPGRRIGQTVAVDDLAPFLGVDPQGFCHTHAKGAFLVSPKTTGPSLARRVMAKSI